MTKTYKMDSFLDVQTLNEQAKKCPATVTVFDANHSWADAKSLLGLMSLLYAEPIRITCDTDDFFHHLPFKEVA